MLEILEWLELVPLFYVTYRILDWLIRTPYVGKYNERYILVTGCDTGFGNLLCKKLDGRGCHVFAGCYTEEGLKELTAVCSTRLRPFLLDVSNEKSVKDAFQFVKSSLPPGKGLWGLMNNAGIMGSLGPTDWHTFQDYRQAADTNLFGVINMTLTFLPLIKLEQGRLVSTSSVVGRLSSSITLPYCVSKFGVEGFMDGMRRGLHDWNIKCSLIEPGVYNTCIWKQTSSTDKRRRLVIKDWNELPVQAQLYYGINYHKHVSTRLVQDCTHILASNKLNEVVEAYEHALLSRRPRARYVVGKDARLFWIPLTYLPESLSDWILRLVESSSIPKPEAFVGQKNGPSQNSKFSASQENGPVHGPVQNSKFSVGQKNGPVQNSKSSGGQKNDLPQNSKSSADQKNDPAQNSKSFVGQKNDPTQNSKSSADLKKDLAKFWESVMLVGVGLNEQSGLIDKEDRDAVIKNIHNDFRHRNVSNGSAWS